MEGWASKAGRSGVQTAHYLDAVGTPLCAAMKFRDGPALAPFTCEWAELREADRRCQYCRRLAGSVLSRADEGPVEARSAAKSDT